MIAHTINHNGSLLVLSPFVFGNSTLPAVTPNFLSSSYDSYQLALGSPSGIQFNVMVGGEINRPRLDLRYDGNLSRLSRRFQLPQIVINTGSVMKHNTARVDEQVAILVDAAQVLTKHIVEGGYKAVIASGKSSYSALTLFISAWKLMAANKASPPIFVFDSFANKVLYDEVWPHYDDTRISDSAREEYVTNYIRDFFPALFNMKDKKIIWIDDYALSGSKLRLIKRLFDGFGFTKLDFGVFVAKKKTKLPEGSIIGAFNDPLSDSFMEFWLAVSRRTRFPFR